MWEVIIKDWFHLHYVALKDFSGPLVAVFGIAVTAGIATAGFQSFNKWRRQKIEERRIDIALEALSIAYESQYVFDGIRSPGSFGYEYADAKKGEDESDEDFNHRKTYYVTLKRIDNNKEFFAKVFKLQPRFMAVFGPETDSIFRQLHMARVEVAVAAQSLGRRDVSQWTEAKAKRHRRLEADIWSGMADAHSAEELPEGDRVQKKIDEFKTGIIHLCRPIVDHEFKVKT